MVEERIRRNLSGELSTVRSNDRGPSDAPDTFVIMVIEGPDAGLRCVVDASSPSRVLVGQSPVCTFRLSDPEVSRRHASLRPLGSLMVVNDLNSTNGTAINGVAIREATVAGGEALRLGRSVLSITRGPPLVDALGDDASFGRVLGESRAMRKLYPLLRDLAASDEAVLLEGESGVGRALVAEEIHAASSRAGRPLITVSCSDLPADEIEERIFGEGGALAAAAGGTLILDEIGDFPRGPEKRLLALFRAHATSARLLLTTRRDLDREVTEGRFSEDVLAAVASSRIEIPPLRERADDVPLLARTFWHALYAEAPEGREPELPVDFLPRWQNYGWPGNVRELARAVSSRFLYGKLARWRPEHGPRDRDLVANVLGRELTLSEARLLVVEDFERRYMSHMIALHGSTRDAAHASGVSVRYFQLLRARLEE